jgi:hypothetical protein
MDSINNNFKSGVHNLEDSENIPKDAAQNAANWFNQDGKVILVGGRLLIGNELGIGKIRALHFGYKVDGTKVLYRKTPDKIQYLNGDTWTDVITGMTDCEVSFANYSSLAGSFTFINCVDGYWKIINSHPTDPQALYASDKNFHGKILVDRGRTILWDRNDPNSKDKTGLYGSWIDRQDSTVYTTVTGEAIGALGSVTYTGILAFKSGVLTCFGVVFSGTVAAGVETFTDDFLGNLTGSRGGYGTINYATGAYSVTFSAVTTGAVTASYQHESSIVKGIGNFTKSTTRLAGEGFQFPQDEGGDPIMNVLIGQDGAYYSLKKNSVYRLELDDTDLKATNLLYRKDIGIPFWKAAVSTSKGIVFINTAKPTKPELTILQRNVVGGEVEPFVILSHFDFSLFTYDECEINSHDRYITILCKSYQATFNDTILMCNISAKTVDILKFPCQVSATADGNYYVGSSITQNVHQLFSGYDDDGEVIDNFWTGKDEMYGVENLKKFKRIRLKGLIDKSQYYEVYIDNDKSGQNLIGTVRGDGSYVDAAASGVIGESEVGKITIGGEPSNANPYFVELKVKTPKFRKRTITIKALGIGYVDFDTIIDHNISKFANKIPKRFRQKQNVNLSGTESNL